MNKFILASTILALSATSFAQSYVSSPTGYLSTSGESYAYYFGYGVEHPGIPLLPGSPQTPLPTHP